LKLEFVNWNSTVMSVIEDCVFLGIIESDCALKIFDGYSKNFAFDKVFFVFALS
jgi:hypothetical protein